MKGTVDGDDGGIWFYFFKKKKFNGNIIYTLKAAFKVLTVNIKKIQNI